jgi:RNA polymerase primary sigma factor
MLKFKQDYNLWNLYVHRIESLPKLGEKEIHKLWKKIKKGNKLVKKRLIEANLKLVLPIAKKYYRPGIDIFDLIEEGNLGLIRAVEKYNLRKKVRFSTYATYWIEQYIRRSIEQHSKTIRIPPHMWDYLRKWLKKWEELHGQLGRYPTLSEMSNKLNFSVKQLKNIVDTVEIYQGMSSLDTPIDEEGESSIKDVIPDLSSQTPEAIISALRLSDEIKTVLSKLHKRERKIIELRFGLNKNRRHTLEEIGKKLHVSRERVRQLEKRAFEQLRWIVRQMKLV